MTSQQILLRDGRRVQVEEYGDPDGAPALWFHGAFSCRLEAWTLDDHARQVGVRVLALDRPGVGGSHPQSGRTVTGYADDVSQVLDALRIEQASVGGLSNGGMYAMAVAASIPERVLRAVPYNPSSPTADEAARAHMPPHALLVYEFMRSHLEQVVDDLVGQPEGTAVQDGAPDAALLNDPYVAAAQTAVKAEARRQGGSEYLRTELQLCTRPWGFDHRAVTVPVSIVSGEHDVGLAYARVWVDSLPNAQLVVVPGGHDGMPHPVVSRRLVELLAAWSAESPSPTPPLSSSR